MTYANNAAVTGFATLMLAVIPMFVIAGAVFGL